NVLAAKQGSNRLYYVQDATDSVIGVFDAAGGFTGGYSYSPYGELRAASDNPVIKDNPLRFASGLWDGAVNLYRLGGRYYDPSLGRFTQYDPTGQEPNPYA
uniref:RHS repeat-associated core domain-containing protein n=1 Tax=Cellulomonas telluris TaxID=2306636 RepID=UPI0010A8A049